MSGPASPETEAPAPLLAVQALEAILPTPDGPVAALRGVDLTIGRGETAALIGESGCGKSMTALALMGLLPEGTRVHGSMRLAPRAGDSSPATELVGLAETAWCRLRGARVAMVFQEPMTALNPLHTVGDQVAEPLRVHRRLPRSEARDRALALLQAVRLPDAAARLDAYPHQLSGGQRQRVGIAMALAAEPDLLLADEPTTALDATLQREILELIAELVRERGMALLLISHDLALVAANVQRVHVMYGGLIVDSGPTRSVFQRLAHPYTRGLHGSRPRLGHARRQPLPALPGRVPSLSEMPAGCAFAARCAWALPECSAALPGLLPVAGEAGAAAHRVRCLRTAELPPPAAAGAEPMRTGTA